MTQEKMLQGGKQIARVLKEEGVEYFFGVGGGHIFPIMVGAGMAGIKMVHCRHEQAGGYIADGYARASGKVGVCFGTAGPGMTNQVSAIAQAQSAKSPVVAFYGQHSTWEDGRHALQEGSAEKALGQYTKWTARVVNPALFCYFTKKAFRDAMTYPQGPVALEFPMDVQSMKTPASSQQGFVENSYTEPAPSYAEPESVEKAVRTLLGAERPVIAGGEAIFWSHAEKELQEFVELTQIPVITRRTGRGAVPEDHPLAFSGRARSAILRGSDVACTIGLNLGYLEGYGQWAIGRKLIQITESKGDIEFTAPSYLVIIANPKAVLKQMTDCAKDLIKGSPRKEAWLKQVNDIKAKERKRMEDAALAVKNNKPINPIYLAEQCCAVLNKDATVILDAFTTSAFVTERFLARHSGAVLDGGNTAGVGHGVGMGIGAQLARPGKQVLVIMGDGGMGLGGFDIETAARSQTPVVYVLSNNSAWMAAIGPLYKRALPTVGVQDEFTSFGMLPIRYDQVFAAMGCHTERVEDPDKLRPALERAFASGKASVLDVVVDRTVASPMMGDLASFAKGGFGSYLDPEDVPDSLRPILYPELAKK